MITSEALNSIRKGIKKTGHVYVTYQHGALKVFRGDSPAINSINSNHLIGVYNGKADEIDIFDDITSFIESYQQEQNNQSKRLNKQMGMVS